MEQIAFSLGAMPPMDFDITKIELDSRSPLNHNEAHIHKRCEVYINLSGDVSFAVENRLYPITRGSVIITRPFEYHHCIYRSNRPHQHFWITFSGEQNQDFLRLFFDREKGMENRLVLQEQELQQVCQILEALIHQPQDTLERRINILRFFQILATSAPDRRAEALENLPEDVAAVLEYADGHLCEDLDVRRLARIGHVSVNTLERHFKESFGDSPVAAIRKKRLLASLMFLRSGESVTDAAQKSGFPDYSNYIQLFRKQFGMTPGKYKRTLENIQKHSLGTR